MLIYKQIIPRPSSENLTEGKYFTAELHILLLFKLFYFGVVEMAQWLRVYTALVEDWSLAPGICTV